MKNPGKASPMVLARWELIGSSLCLTAAVQAIVFTLHKVGGHGVGTFSSSRPRLAAFLFLAGCGAGISIMVESWLRKGMKGNAWTEEDLEPVRRVFDHHIWTVLAYIPFASAFLLLTLPGNHYVYVLPLLIMPMRAGLTLRQILKRQVADRNLTELSAFAPLRSEHWVSRASKHREAISLRKF